ncbi:hypothetical protein E3N88_37142 [Mikania micrantha]|uniref:Uncharacterized protein n=1 Tax=Mikania micrantha TaxID=192012 RepID=A0A5N6M681_9ASTR|nr:hypothetical protein E3N88_37142 [Mikania micrantha]
MFRQLPHRLLNRSTTSATVRRPYSTEVSTDASTGDSAFVEAWKKTWLKDIIGSLGWFAIDFHMPPICSPIVRPGRHAEAAPVVSKQLADTIFWDA